MVSHFSERSASRVQRVVQRLGTLLAVLFAAAFLSGFVFSRFAGQFPGCRLAEICFPLSHPCALTVGSNGEITVASGFYGRIQVYSADGVFLRGFFYSGDGGDVRLNCDVQGRLFVYSYRRHELLTVSATGQVIRRDRIERLPDDWPDQFYCRVNDGRELFLRNTVVSPRVDTDAPDGSQSTIITNSWWVMPFAGPVAPWMGLVVLTLGPWLVTRIWKGDYSMMSNGKGIGANGDIAKLPPEEMSDMSDMGGRRSFRVQISHSEAERQMAATYSPLVASIFVITLFISRDLLVDANWLARWLVWELLLSVLMFSVAAFIWGRFRPNWCDRLLVLCTNHFIKTVLLVGLFPVLAALCIAVHAFWNS